jgi:hypothetical protein
MKKDILAKAVRLADKSKARPDKVVISKPTKGTLAQKPAAEIMSERLYTRVTPREMKRLKARIGDMLPTSALLRDLLIQYLDNKDREHGRKKI